MASVVLKPHGCRRWVFGMSMLGGVALGVQLVAFALRALIRGRAEPSRGARSVVVLGCDLDADGAVTRLLASRLDRAIEILDAQSDGETRPMVVVSGGQGTAATVPEAVAMQRYLVEYGVDAGDIVIESFSRNTHENLVKTQQLLQARDAEPMVVVTSDFHVWRTAAYARDLGMDAHVTGARTPARYLPTAFLREFAATIRRNWKSTAVLMVMGFAVRGRPR